MNPSFLAHLPSSSSLVCADADEEGGDGEHGGSGLPTFPFETAALRTDEGIRSLAPAFWYDGTFAQLNWWQSTIQWGRWSYDSRSMTMTHALTRRSFVLSKLDSPERLLQAVSSLLLQPHGESERFYQLIYGLLKYRHGVSIDEFFHRGLSILQSEPLPNPRKKDAYAMHA